MPCMSGIFRSSTIRSTGSIASRSMASRPLPAWVDLTLRRVPSEVITMRLIVGESSTTKILFILISSDTSARHTSIRQILAGRRGTRGKSGNHGKSGTPIVRESTGLPKSRDVALGGLGGRPSVAAFVEKCLSERRAATGGHPYNHPQYEL